MRCCQTGFTASSFSGSRHISSMDGPVYFHLLSPNIALGKKISTKQQSELKLSFWLQSGILSVILIAPCLMRNAPTALSALSCAIVCTTHLSPLPLTTPTANYQHRQQPQSSLSLSWLAQDACYYTSYFKLPDSHCWWKGAGGSGKENRVKSRFVCTPMIT